MAYAHRYEQLDVYKLSVQVARWVRSSRWPRGEADLKKQCWRASQSIVLNISEGFGVGGNSGRNHFRIASGSACEVCSALDLIELPGGPENQQKLRRICAMLNKLQRG